MQYLLRNKIGLVILCLCISSAALAQRDEVFRPNHDELPYYLSWFDKCFLPFKDCELTKYVNPCKLCEYMASEKEIIKYNVNMDCSKIIPYDIICNKILNRSFWGIRFFYKK